MMKNLFKTISVAIIVISLLGCGDKKNDVSKNPAVNVAQTNGVDQCVIAIGQEYRKEVGEGALIRQDMIEEWEKECRQESLEMKERVTRLNKEREDNLALAAKYSDEDRDKEAKQKGYASHDQMIKAQIVKDEAENAENERRGNFLIGLCEIPHASDLNDCSMNSIANSSSGGGSYWIFRDDSIRFFVGSSNSVPEKYRIRREFSAKTSYEVRHRTNEVVVTTVDTEGVCFTTKKYKKNGNEIIVTEGPMTGSCSDMQNKLHELADKEYVMRWRSSK